MDNFYKLISHTADLGIEVEAKDLSGIYINSARALFDLMLGIDQIESKIEKELLVEGMDRDDLLVVWLNELIYLFSTQRYLFSDFELQFLSEKRLKSLARGEKFDPSRHQLKNEIKAATYHAIEIKEGAEGFSVSIIFDV